MDNQKRQDGIYNDILKSSNIIRTIFPQFSSGASINSLEKSYLHIFSTKLVFLLVNSIDYSGTFFFMSGYSFHLKNNINKLKIAPILKNFQKVFKSTFLVKLLDKVE